MEPIPSAEGSLQEVTQAKVKLSSRGAGSTLATASPRPAELAFVLVSIKGVRLGLASAPQPVATLRGQLRIDPETEQPIFDTVGNNLLTNVELTDEPDQNRLALTLDAASFGAERSFTLPLPPQTDDVDKLELRVELRIGGATESSFELNDFFDGFFRKVEIIEPKVVALTFVSDHQGLLDNDADLTGKGAPIGQPEWRFGQSSRPILHTKNTPVRVTIELEIHPANADPVDCVVEGVSKGGLPPLTFRLEQRLRGGKTTLSLSSAEALPDDLQRLSGKIEWSVTVPKKGKLKAGDSFGHVIYLTLGKPEDPPGLEAGITRRRVERAQRLVKDTGTLDPHQVIKRLMTNVFPNYTIDPDPRVPEKLKHPTYFNGSEGGAWRILEHLESAAECQAIVRVVGGIGKVLGMPGLYEAVTATVDADTGLEFEDPTGRGLRDETRTLNGRTVFPFLVPEEPGQVGRVFEIGAPGSPNLNFFEACLRFTHDGKTKLYPGGMSGADFDDVVQVIGAAFTALIWVSDVPPATPNGRPRARLERIVKRY